jgi:serine/threonine protein phosphatase 1
MIAVIGDIHGCFHTLKELVESIRKNYPGVQIYCVGDMVDRGIFNLEAVDYIINEGIIATSGNHDFMFYYFIKVPDNYIGRSWVFNGYEKTLASYSDNQNKMEEHLNYIKSMPLYINLDDCFIAHAGVSKYYTNWLSPDPLNDKDKFDGIIKSNIDSEHGIIWNRDQLLDLGKLQIIGHTRQENVNYLKFNNVAYIDTSVYTGNKLSAVIIEEGKIKDTLFVNTFPQDIMS